MSNVQRKDGGKSQQEKNRKQEKREEREKKKKQNAEAEGGEIEADTTGNDARKYQRS